MEEMEDICYAVRLSCLKTFDISSIFNLRIPTSLGMLTMFF